MKRAVDCGLQLRALWISFACKTASMAERQTPSQCGQTCPWSCNKQSAPVVAMRASVIVHKPRMCEAMELWAWCCLDFGDLATSGFFFLQEAQIG